jgi:hypothetical protein
MKKILAFALALMFAAPGVYAQSGSQQGPRLYGDFKPVVGGWSEYQVMSAGQPPMKMKVGIVGREGSAYWYETVMQGGVRMVSKLLVSGNPSDGKNLKRMIVKAGNEQAMEMDVAGMSADRQAAKGAGPAGKVADKGMETVTVPAGTFKARHVQYQDGSEVVDAWVTDKVTPYGLVKAKSRNMEMVLTGQGTGAKTLITETPKKFTMPQIPKGLPIPKGTPQGAMPGMGGAGN